jgi:hypothetical protein
MGYLVLNDYFKLIQETNLNQVISSSDANRLAAESIADTEIKSYLSQKYDLSEELTDTTVFNMVTAYKAGALVELNFDAYSDQSTYALKALVTFSGKCYVCTTAVTAAEAFDSAKWTLLGNKNDLFYVKLPNPRFDINETIKAGDVRFWKDKNYTAVLPSSSGNPSIQYMTKDNIPYKNVMPDDPVNGLAYWGAGVAYEVAAETLPTDSSKWTKGDNRSQKMIQVYIDIAIYHLHARISQQNVPTLRLERYMGKHEDKVVKAGRLMFPEYSALGWLQSMAGGELTADFPTIQPKKGQRIRFGGSIPMQTEY